MAGISGGNAGSTGANNSRYLIDPNTYARATDNVVTSSGGGLSSTSGSSTTSTNQNQTQISDQTVTNNSTTKNMTSGNQAALDRLIQQLLSGGTPEMKAQIAARQAETQQVGNIREAYSKGAAFGDAQGLISQQMRRTLESLIPSINHAAEDAGSSGGALRALLLQDAANKAAESSSALGVQTATNYGNISSNLSQVMERLTASDPTVTQALLNALNVSKGATVTTKGTQNTVGTQNTQTSGTSSTNSNSSTASSENKQVSTDYAPFGVQANTTPQYFGPSTPTVDPTKYIGTTMDTLAQLSGAGNPWTAYAF